MLPTRLVTLEDAPALAQLLRRNHDFLAPWEPLRNDEYETVEGQREVIRAALDDCKRGLTLPHVILDASGDLAGRITLNGITRGAFQSCSVGYWVSQSHNGKGLATSALRHLVGLAFGELGLHRVQAETLLHNVASQRVLERNGFVRIGYAPSYLKIAGRWQDFILYQVINHQG